MLQIQPTVAAWLKNRRASPEFWMLPPSESDRISNSNIAIAIAFPAASILNLRTFQSLDAIEHLIVLDASFLHGGTITADQQIGIILHEIGHVLNPPPKVEGQEKSERQLLSERYADYYTHLCGYGAHFADAMETMSANQVFGFDEPDICNRIQILRSPSITKLLNLQ